MRADRAVQLVQLGKAFDRRSGHQQPAQHSQADHLHRQLCVAGWSQLLTYLLTLVDFKDNCLLSGISIGSIGFPQSLASIFTLQKCVKKLCQVLSSFTLHF